MTIFWDRYVYIHIQKVIEILLFFVAIWILNYEIVLANKIHSEHFNSHEEAFLKITEQIETLVQMPKHQNPRIVVLDFFNYESQEKDHISQKIESLLTETLFFKLPENVVPGGRIKELIREWNDTYPGSYREPLTEDLAGQANADWMITGTYEAIENFIGLNLELYDLASEKILWQSMFFYSQIPAKEMVESSTMVESTTNEFDDDFSDNTVHIENFRKPSVVPEESNDSYHFMFRNFPIPSNVKSNWSPPDGMVLISEGEFIMGNPKGNSNEKPDHLVSLQSFFLDLHEVTNQEYAQCSICERGHGGFDTTQAEQPVVYVDWINAREYCISLGKRLPTEAEWEFAARAGTTTDFSFGDSQEMLSIHVWNDNNTMQMGLVGPQIVATKPANPWGLYDMHGNVMEWTNDSYQSDYSESLRNTSPSKDPIETENSKYPLKVVRGGAWSGLHGAGTAEGLRASKRYAFAVWVSSFQIGFRCAADVPHQNP